MNISTRTKKYRYKSSYGVKTKLRSKVLIAVLLVLSMAFTSVSFASTSVSRYTGSTYTHSSTHLDSVIVDGVDVSIYQSDVDWQKIKSDGIDFAIVRIGGRGYTSGSMYEDEYFYKHFTEAKEAGLLVGVYFYSQAKNATEAEAEVDYVSEIMEYYGLTPDDLDLPLFMDYEFGGNSSTGRLYGLSKSTRTKAVNGWLAHAKELGYTPGIYAGLNFACNSFDGASVAENYYFWGAQYYSLNQFDFPNIWWQYSSSGKAYGYSGRLDVNFWYLNLTPRSTLDITSRGSLKDESGFAKSKLSLDGMATSSITACTCSIIGTDTFTYADGQKYEPQVSVTHNGLQLTEGTDYKVRYVKNTQAGTAYALVIGKGFYADYQVVPFTINPSQNLDLSIEDIGAKTYTGKAITPQVSITDALGRKLIKNLDYTVTASNNTDAGTGQATVTLTGNYEGTLTKDFVINKGEQTISISDMRTTVDISEGTYNLGASLKFDGTIQYVSSDPSVLSVSEDGTVTPIKKGQASISVIFAETSNIKGASVVLDITVTSPKENQTVTTKYTRYTRESDGKGFTITGTTDGDGAISYASSNPLIATIDSKGKVSLVCDEVGTVEFYVKASETDKYNEGQKIVYLTVTGMTNAERMEEEARLLEQKNLKIIEGVENSTLKLKSTVVTTASGKKAFKLSWTKAKVDGTGYLVDYYQVFRSTKKNSGYTLKPIYTTKSGSVLTYTNTKDFVKGTTYYYKVRGVRTVGEETCYTPWSNKAYRKY